MFKRTATDLTKLPGNVVKEWLNSFDSVLTDCDGELHHIACESSFGILNFKIVIELQAFYGC